LSGVARGRHDPFCFDRASLLSATAASHRSPRAHGTLRLSERINSVLADGACRARSRHCGKGLAGEGVVAHRSRGTLSSPLGLSATACASICPSARRLPESGLGAMVRPEGADALCGKPCAESRRLLVPMQGALLGAEGVSVIGGAMTKGEYGQASRHTIDRRRLKPRWD
jgi:hypothetical protein